MTPQEYIGVDPYGNTSKMAKIVISETAFLPLAKISQTGNHILSMWMFSNADRTVTLYYGDKNIELNLTTSWQSYEHKMELAVDDGIYLELSAGTYYIWHAQLERATKKSDWMVAPEDVDASVDAKLEKYATLEITDDKISLVAASTKTYTDNAVNEMGASVDTKLEDYATLEVTNNKISTAVTETKTYADGKASDAVSTAKSYTDQTAKSITATVEGVDGRLTKMEQDADGFTWTIDETAIVASVNEYYKSTSPTLLSGGSWSTTQPEWTPGIYIWMRSKNTNGKGVSSYTTPVCVTDNVEVGGRNLILKTKSFDLDSNRINGWSNERFTWAFETDTEGFVVASTSRTGVTSNAIRSLYSTKYPVNNGDTVTFSCWFMVDDITVWDGPQVPYIFEIYDSSGTRIQYQDVYITTSNSNRPTIKSGKWVYFYSTHTVNNENAYSVGMRLTLFRNGSIHIKKCKVEKGNKATDWTPAPEDVDFAIGNVEIGGRNLLSDTNVPSYVKKAAPANRYLSDSANANYSVGSFVAVSNLPIPEFTHVYQFECTTASSTSTDGRSLCFYSGNAIPMIDGQEYTMSMYARKTSGNGKIRFLIGYSSYTNYSNHIDVTSEWERYSYTFTYSDSATGGTGGARCYFGASCAVVGVVQTFGWKLEKGNKATDWNLSVEDIVYASNEAAKTATNYMKFKDNGLTIGNMTKDTLGKNVLIDLDSVDIRNGTEVLATYGEEIILRNNGLDVFTVKKSTFIQQIKSAGRFLEADSEGTGSTHNVTGTFYTPVTISKDLYYIWHIKLYDKYLIFRLTKSSLSLKYITYSYDKPARALLQTSTSSWFYVPCAYCDADSIVDLDIQGSVWISNESDVSGHVKSISPLAIGTRGGVHLELDNNEIMSKTDDSSTGTLYLNSEGGDITFNNNSIYGMKYSNGSLYTRIGSIQKGESEEVETYSDWYELVRGASDSTFSTRYGYGAYQVGGTTSIFGREVRLYASGNVVSNTNFIVPNDLSYFGTNTSGALRNNFQPCDSSNNCVVGYGSYSAGEGRTNIYGNITYLYSNSSIYLFPNAYTYTDSDLVFYNAQGISGKNISGTTRRNFQPCDDSNNCVIGYGSYSAGEGQTNLYGKNVSIIANGSITFNPSGTIKAPSRTLTTLWNGALYMGEGHSVSLSDSISNQLNGIVLAWSAYVNNAAQEYWWNYTFIPKEHVSKHYGAAIGVTLTGGHLGYKYVYITSTTITGDADNNKASKVISGVTYKPNYYVLRHVFGV